MNFFQSWLSTNDAWSAADIAFILTSATGFVAVGIPIIQGFFSRRMQRNSAILEEFKEIFSELISELHYDSTVGATIGYYAKMVNDGKMEKATAAMLTEKYDYNGVKLNTLQMRFNMLGIAYGIDVRTASATIDRFWQSHSMKLSADNDDKDKSLEIRIRAQNDVTAELGAVWKLVADKFG